VSDPLSLAQLESQVQTHRDVPIKGLGVFRVRMVGIEDKLRLSSIAETYPKKENGEFENKLDGCEFGIEVLSACLIDKDGIACYDNDQGRSLLTSLFFQIQPVIEEAMELNGLVQSLPDNDDAKLEEKKSG